MSNPPDKNRPSAPPDSEVLANIPKGAADQELQANPPRTAASHQKAAPANDDQLKRPRGALVAMRKSGGIRFTWRLLVVRADGRVIYKSNELGAPRAARAVGQLDAAQLADLQALIKRTDFGVTAPGAARQNPDAFAYELIARAGRKNVFAEAFEGSIPEALKPLIQYLNRLLPAPDSAPEPAAEAE
jgi:hypothetical protein